MNEDLTAENNKLAYDARQLRRNGQIYDTFTCDGRIYVRMNQGNRPKAIRDYDHLMSRMLARNHDDSSHRRSPMPWPQQWDNQLLHLWHDATNELTMEICPGCQRSTGHLQFAISSGQFLMNHQLKLESQVNCC